MTKDTFSQKFSKKNRLPGTLKRRYLDCPSKNGFDLDRPGFGFLRQFVMDELSVMRSDYAQTFFRSNEKENLRDSGARRSICVRQATVQLNTSNNFESENLVTSSRGSNSQRSLKPPSLCFVCNDSNSRHYLGECEKFKTFSPYERKHKVVAAGRCLNCLSLGHVVCNCLVLSKCRRCGPRANNKHARPSHECFSRLRSVAGGAVKPALLKGTRREHHFKIMMYS